MIRSSADLLELAHHRLDRCMAFRRARRAQDSGDDSRIGSAAADVSLHILPNLLRCRMRIRSQERNRGDNHPRSAVPTLQRAFRQECFLDSTQAPVHFQALDCGDLSRPDHADGRHAGMARVAIDQDRARATLALATPIFGAG